MRCFNIWETLAGTTALIINRNKGDRTSYLSGTTIRFYANKTAVWKSCREKTFFKLNSGFPPTSCQSFKGQLSTHLKITFGL